MGVARGAERKGSGMSKYRKKPVVIEAWQFTDENKDRLYHDLTSMGSGAYPVFRDGKPALLIPTLEGEMTASIGDFIIKGVNGEFYPCKPEIFEKTYELVEEST